MKGLLHTWNYTDQALQAKPDGKLRLWEVWSETKNLWPSTLCPQIAPIPLLYSALWDQSYRISKLQQHF